MNTDSHPQTNMIPPVAKKQPQILELHGDRRIDNYFWMRDQENPQVISYLEAENTYTDGMMHHTQGLQTQLYEEILARIKESDFSVPYRQDDYYYYSRTEAGKAYPIYCRKRGSLDGIEEILLDQNQLANGHDFCDLGVLAISPNHQIMAYSIDTTGAERYTLFFLDLNSHQLYADIIEDTYFSLAWANDNKTVFYTTIDEANRPFKLFRHTLGCNIADDELIYHEPDDGYHLYVDQTRSQEYLFLTVGGSITSEVHYLKADNPLGKFEVIAPRSTGILYDIEHHSDYFYIVTNEAAINFKLMKTPVANIGKDNWQTVIPHRPDVRLSGVSAFINHLVIYERKGGLPTARIQNLNTGAENQITFPEPTYDFEEDTNAEFNTNILRFNYTSLITPPSVFDYNMDTNQRELKKETEVLGGYDRTQYRSEWLMATADDGTSVPISIVYPQNIKKRWHKSPIYVGIWFLWLFLPSHLCIGYIISFR